MKTKVTYEVSRVPATLVLGIQWRLGLGGRGDVVSNTQIYAIVGSLAADFWVPVPAL